MLMGDGAVVVPKGKVTDCDLGGPEILPCHPSLPSCKFSQKTPWLLGVRLSAELQQRTINKVAPMTQWKCLIL